VAGVLAVVVVASACSTTGGDVDAPADSEPTADLIAAGEPLYQASCAQCHGTDLRGTSLGPSHLSIVYEPNHHGDAAFVLAARAGVRQHHWLFGNMPPIPGLSDDDLDAIVAYVRDQQSIHGFEPYPP
jgi:mono/diheme cytochrome c family protein